MKRQASFNVASRRTLNLASNVDIPGPAAYDVDLSSKQPHATHIAKLTEKRWKSTKDNKPGPADYELAPVFQDTLLKGTFNATLNNPLVLKSSQKLANSDPALSLLSKNHNNKLNFNSSIEKVNQPLKVA